jgi:hypothetical protein
MDYQSNFKRHELKYLLTIEQKEQILKDMKPYMALDQYGRTTIRNLYFDTDNFLLVRRSIEKPVYKEKMRVRSYRQTQPGEPVFVELKKKFDSVVYKRRVALKEEDVLECFEEGTPLPVQSQIADEINYFREHYQNLKPVMYLSYEREAFYALNGSDFRVTFDENILCRRQQLSLQEESYGTPLLEDGQVLMEIKTSSGIPLWMTHSLTEQKIFRTSFSKYGTAYQKTVFTYNEGGAVYA